MRFARVCLEDPSRWVVSVDMGFAPRSASFEVQACCVDMGETSIILRGFVTKGAGRGGAGGGRR